MDSCRPSTAWRGTCWSWVRPGRWRTRAALASRATRTRGPRTWSSTASAPRSPGTARRTRWRPRRKRSSPRGSRRGDDLFLRGRHRVRRAVPGERGALAVEDQVRGPRVLVARLANAARVRQRPGLTQLQHVPLHAVLGLQLSIGTLDEAARDVRVPDQAERAVEAGQAAGGRA